MKATFALLATAAVTLPPGLDLPCDAAIFEAVLVAVTTSSSMGKRARIDPRIVSVGAVAIDSAALVPARDDRIERRRERARGLGYAEGDVFLAKECTSAGRITITQGADTLVRPGRPPIPDELRGACEQHRRDGPMVLIQRDPERTAGGWTVRAHIRGDGAGENWVVRLNDALEVLEARLILAWRS